MMNLNNIQNTTSFNLKDYFYSLKLKIRVLCLVKDIKIYEYEKDFDIFLRIDDDNN